jgi:two-component system, OmpR family, phosphate regulon sensor histidine kinase PhoR
MSRLHHDAWPRDSHVYLDLQRASDFQAALLGMAGHDLRQPPQIIQSTYERLGRRVGNISEKVRLDRGERPLLG